MEVPINISVDDVKAELKQNHSDVKNYDVYGRYNVTGSQDVV